VYITPTPEYDRLNHSDKNTLQLDNGVYDRNTQNYTGYNTAMFHVRQPEGDGPQYLELKIHTFM
jgi:hypothetical protein